MNGCKWDRDTETYLTADGEPCRRDDNGDPTRHCTARRSCAMHVYGDEITCARCVSRTRQDIRAITEQTPLLMVAALGGGVNSEAANLAGPAADVEAWSWRKVAARQGVAWHVSLLEDDDEKHPYTVLTRWEFMLREDYRQQREDASSVSRAADYLDWTLHRMAQDREQDFPLMAREIHKCRSHLESVLHNSSRPERGAPCPECTSQASGLGPRLVRKYPHWCTDPECTQQFHYSTVLDGLTGEARPDTAGDWWVCPRDRDHAWSHEDYQRWVEERTA